ncbi:flagellar basal body L-ring protein FlgH [Paraburkholderia heleia]|uniref:flagellar basal body L-ring protein FlgH n=1 Tax=Paraburkholderia heleia TaxID=634127 RepID=UPI002AB75806|nr:flagellar basal body L-ring protein FlgH [Paraburkholderia heleia]
MGSASTSFNDSDAHFLSSDMTGTLTVTIFSKTPTGNRVVSGEKLIAMSGELRRLRLSGIVNPNEGADNYEPTRRATRRMEHRA